MWDSYMCGWWMTECEAVTCVDDGLLSVEVTCVDDGWDSYMCGW